MCLVQSSPPSLITTARAGRLGCPFKNCPYVTKDNPLTATGCLTQHISRRHGLHVIPGEPVPTVPGPEVDDEKLCQILPTANAPTPGLTSPPGSPITVRGTRLQAVKAYKYLGSLISFDGGLRGEIDARCRGANAAFKKLPKGFWASEDLSLWVKWEIYKHLVLPVLLYGAESWVPTPHDIDALESTYMRHVKEMCSLRTTVKVCYPSGPEYHIPSRAEAAAIFGEPRIEALLRTARLRLYGQAIRAGPYSFLGKWAHTSAEPGNVPRGPKKQNWSSLVYNDLHNSGLQTSQCYARNSWKKLIAYQPRGPTPILREE